MEFGQSMVKTMNEPVNEKVKLSIGLMFKGSVRFTHLEHLKMQNTGKTKEGNNSW